MFRGEDSEKAEVVRKPPDFDIVHCPELSREEVSFRSETIYNRLFYKGKCNIYELDSEELVEAGLENSEV